MDPYISKSCSNIVCNNNPPILPYILNLNTCVKIWEMVEKHLIASNWACIVQIKRERHNLSMNNKIVNQHLSNIKSKVDLIAIVESTITTDDIIYHTLSGLLPSHQSFKTAIHTNLQPLTLDYLYSLLCSEEIIQQSYVACTEQTITTTFFVILFFSQGRNSQHTTN